MLQFTSPGRRHEVTRDSTAAIRRLVASRYEMDELGMAKASRPIASKAIGVVGALVLVVVTMAAPTTASAMSYVGTGYPSDVMCDETGNFMEVTPAAWPAAGLSSQWVRFSIAIWDVSRNRQVAGYWPSNWGAPFNVGTFTEYHPGYSVTYSVSQGQPFRVYLPNGRYSVQTLYSFYYGGQWFDAKSWIATTAYKTYFYNMTNSLCMI
jgi:hypothetical protein